MVVTNKLFCFQAGHPSTVFLAACSASWNFLSIIVYPLFLWNPLFKKSSRLHIGLPLSENESQMVDIIRVHLPYCKLDEIPDDCPLPEINGLQKQPYASLKRLENG
jgi:hypothetical protein